MVTLRREVREGRSFSPDEFAIALEQVVAGTAPLDYRDPAQFFSRTCFTRALNEHAGMVLRRLAGGTQNTSPVLTLVTRFGGGKTHTLTALYHLAKAGRDAASLPGVADLVAHASVPNAPEARVGVFVGNTWDLSEGRETPWIDLARQLAGDKGAAGVAAVINLPRSQVEMTDWDRLWQGRITKVVRRVARDLIANDKSEIGDVVRRRLFEDLGGEPIRKRISKMYAEVQHSSQSGRGAAAPLVMVTRAGGCRSGSARNAPSWRRVSSRISMPKFRGEPATPSLEKPMA